MEFSLASNFKDDRAAQPPIDRSLGREQDPLSDAGFSQCGSAVYFFHARVGDAQNRTTFHNELVILLLPICTRSTVVQQGSGTRLHNRIDRLQQRARWQGRIYVCRFIFLVCLYCPSLLSKRLSYLLASTGRRDEHPSVLEMGLALRPRPRSPVPASHARMGTRSPPHSGSLVCEMFCLPRKCCVRRQ